MKAKVEIRNFLVFFILPLFVIGCVTPGMDPATVSPEELDAAKEELNGNIKAIGNAVIDAIPTPIPKDAPKDMLGWIADIMIVGGGGAGAAGYVTKKAIQKKNGT